MLFHRDRSIDPMSKLGKNLAAVVVSSLALMLAFWVPKPSPVVSDSPWDNPAQASREIALPPPLPTSIERVNVLEASAEELETMYFELTDEFERIQFLALFEEEEPTEDGWNFLETAGFKEKSIEVVEALLISADMSDNDSRAKRLFAQYAKSHPDKDIREFAAELLDERVAQID
jgi:hypothetical protein